MVVIMFFHDSRVL